MRATQANGAKGMKSDWFAKPGHYSRAGRGKEGFDQRLWEQSMQRAMDLKEPILALEAELLRQWYEAGGKTNLSVPFHFSNEYLLKAGVSRKTKYRYLNRLEKAGWIQVERKTGEDPKIRIKRLF